MNLLKNKQTTSTTEIIHKKRINYHNIEGEMSHIGNSDAESVHYIQDKVDQNMQTEVQTARSKSVKSLPKNKYIAEHGYIQH